MIYSLLQDIRPEVIGTPTWQIKDFAPTTPYEVWKDCGPDQLKDTSINNQFIDGYRFDNGAIETDFIAKFRGSKYNIFLASEEFITVLKDFKLPDHDLLQPVLYKDSNPIYGYKIFRQTDLTLDRFIDFQNSSYIIKNIGDSGSEYLSVTSFEEFAFERKVNRGLKYLIGKKIQLKSEFDFDLFHIHSLNGLFVSEKLAQRIKYEGLTGMEFAPTSEIVY